MPLTAPKMKNGYCILVQNKKIANRVTPFK